MQPEYGYEKRFHAHNESRKREETEAIGFLNPERIRTLGKKENCKYFGILEADTVKKR